MKKALFLMTLSFITYFSYGQKINNSTVYNTQKMDLKHVFKDKKGTILGYLYTNHLKDNFKVFDTLVITKSNKEGAKVLYAIERNKLIIVPKKTIDMKTPDDGFYGYKFILIKSDYIVINYLRNNGKSVSDDATIEWDYLDRNFGLIKL